MNGVSRLIGMRFEVSRKPVSREKDICKVTGCVKSKTDVAFSEDSSIQLNYKRASKIITVASVILHVDRKYSFAVALVRFLSSQRPIEILQI